MIYGGAFLSRSCLQSHQEMDLVVEEELGGKWGLILLMWA